MALPRQPRFSRDNLRSQLNVPGQKNPGHLHMLYFMPIKGHRMKFGAQEGFGRRPSSHHPVDIRCSTIWTTVLTWIPDVTQLYTSQHHAHSALPQDLPDTAIGSTLSMLRQIWLMWRTLSNATTYGTSTTLQLREGYVGSRSWARSESLTDIQYRRLRKKTFVSETFSNLI